MRGTIVVFAKVPCVGTSKTRLIPFLGAEGSVLMAEAMLSDVLEAINNEVGQGYLYIATRMKVFQRF
jgi:glycosyltransferase A (GT-A) superfamily protein (DUF2064 family)